MIKKLKTKFNGLVVYEGKIYSDNRGNLREAFNKRDIPKNLCLSIVSKSKKNVLRGLHLQIKKPQDKIISVLKGKILDVVVDLRKNSKTFGQHFKIILSEKKAKYLFIPRGFAHGFQTLQNDTNLLYFHDQAYNLKAESGISFFSPELSIKLDLSVSIISDRDKKLPVYEV